MSAYRSPGPAPPPPPLDEVEESESSGRNTESDVDSAERREFLQRQRERRRKHKRKRKRNHKRKRRKQMRSGRALRIPRKHRLYHGKQREPAERESKWFQCMDEKTRQIYYYCENDETVSVRPISRTGEESRNSNFSDESADTHEGPEDNSTVWDRPSDLASAVHLALEWDTLLDPDTNHFFFASRLWPNVVIWRVPNGVDAKRIAHLERKSVRALAAETVIEHMIAAIERTDSSSIVYPPSTSEKANNDLLKTWNEGCYRLKSTPRSTISGKS